MASRGALEIENGLQQVVCAKKSSSEPFSKSLCLRMAKFKDVHPKILLSTRDVSQAHQNSRCISQRVTGSSPGASYLYAVTERSRETIAASSKGTMGRIAGSFPRIFHAKPWLIFN